MTRNFQKTAVAVAVCFTMAGAAAAEQTRVGIAAEPYPPFASKDANGTWQGWEIDFTNAICAQAELDCAIVELSYDGLIPALNAGKIDMFIASMNITENRLKVIDFSDYYYKTTPAIMGAKGVDLAVTPEGLNGLTIGVQASSIHETYVLKHYPDAIVKVYQTGDESFNDLASGRIDAVQADIIAMNGYLQSDQGQTCCELKGQVEDDPSILGSGVGIGLRKDEQDLKLKVNAAIREIRENGTYDSFSKKYFDFDIYGG